jgi:DNA-binding transcriptional ArsR family regulator
MAVMVVASSRDAAVFGAIGHPARRRMLDLLAEAGRSVNALAGHFEMSRPTSPAASEAAI